MELEKLQSFVLLIVFTGLLIGIGVLTLDKFGSITYYNRIGYNDSVSWTNNTLASLDFGNISNVVVWNGTKNSVASDCFAIDTTAGKLNVSNVTASYCSSGNLSVVENPLFVVYDYKNYDTQTARATNNARIEVSGIASNWLGLIVTVGVLALILGLVLRSFGGSRNR